jgi:NADH-quinone oxidoreductase subunit G
MSEHFSATQTHHIQRTEKDLDVCAYRQPLIPPTGPDAKPLPKLTLDGQVIEFAPGETIMQAAERANVAAEIPRFCYHPSMPIAGTCRMCTVEVEKAPKLMTSCSTPAADGMVVHTKSERVLKSRNGVMEFLLTNHPLDCPVCDKAGECDLQDYDFQYGPSTSRFLEDKRVFTEATTKKLSDKITLNMNRCVHCERCVRFTEDVTKTHDLIMVNRGWHKELAATDEKKGLTNDYQGCLTDFCPVGALTWNDFRFEKRVWFLDKAPTLCDGCAKGCNIEVHSDKDVIHRLMPIYNEKVNGHWMCDEGRFSYHTHVDPTRLVSPLLKDQSRGGLHSVTWEAALQVAKSHLQNRKESLFVVGTDATNEEASLTQKLFAHSATVRFFNGTGPASSPVFKSSDNKPLDHLLRQSDKTANTKGVEACGLTALQAQDLKEKKTAVFVRFGRAALPRFENLEVILIGVFHRQELEELKQKGVNVVAFLPGLATPEKTGSMTNCDGLTQTFERAIQHTGHAQALDKIWGALGA